MTPRVERGGGVDALPRVTKVSVIVPVFNPGTDIDRLISSLLSQTMPAPEREFVFVDDGSTDATGARLDALAAAHADVRVVHTPNSGWPGRPRNLGLDLAEGEFVFFADNDDWLDREALERLYAVATTHSADIVIGKVVGHGRMVPRIFTEDRHGLDARRVPLGLLTPHKLFRRTLLEQHGIRFPEARRRLEDHLFVVPAYFAAERISVLSSHPIYHWMRRASDASASRQRADPAAHVESLRELMTMVDDRTAPGALRDRYHLHWYRSKVLRRLGRATAHQRDREYRVQVYEATRQLMEERFPPRLDDRLAYNLWLRARLARRGDLEGLERLAAFDDGVRARARVVGARTLDRSALVRVRCGLRWHGGPAVPVARDRERLLWQPPAELEGLWGESERDLATALDARTRVVLRSQDDKTEWVLPTATTIAVPRARDGEAVRARVVAEVRVDPAVAAAGAPLPPGWYTVRVTVSLAGFAAEAPAHADGEPFAVIVTPDGHATPSHQVEHVPRGASRAGRVTHLFERVKAMARVPVRSRS
jgi:glycosyltransferase involved in cell wall biosynthesis